MKINRKTIKEFLKPSRKKVLLFIAIGIILLFIPMIHCDIHYRVFPNPNDAWSTSLLCSPHKCISDSLLTRYGGGFTECSWNSLLLIYISTYLFSCMMIHLFKVKARNNNHK